MGKAKALADFAHSQRAQVCGICRLKPDIRSQIDAHYRTNGGIHAKVRRWLKNEYGIEVSTAVCYHHYSNKHHKTR